MFKSREKRNVRHRGDPVPPGGGFVSRDHVNGDKYDFEPAKKPHRWLKRLLIFLIIVLLLVFAAAAIAYFYIDKTTLSGERAGRINILVLGVDDAANLSDTMMLVSIQTIKDQPYKVAMVSIPRDLYVEIPGYGSSKINAAYTYGQNNKYPGGGPALTKKTIEDTLDIPINYYVAMDFTGFKQVVDTIGGVDINVKTPLEDPYYPDYQGGYNPISFAAGPQHMNGEQALAYSRSRQTSSDFDRSARQQQVAIAVKDKVLSARLFSNPTEISKIQSTLSVHVKTDLSLRELAKLGQIARQVQPQNVTRHVIDNTNFLVVSQRYGYGLIPKAGVGVFTEVHDFIQNIFSQTTNNVPQDQQ